jgi:hypothetical protein
MNLVTLAESVSIVFEKSTGYTTSSFEAGREYVMSLSQFNRLTKDPAVNQRVFKNSRIEARIPNFNINARKPGSQKLLLYNGSGGYGDQIMTWPFARILTTMGFEIHVMCDPGNTVCWWNFPWIKSLQPVPMQYEQFKMFDYHVMMEGVTNTDEHQDQDHPLDTMLRKVGIDPYTVDAKLKVMRPNFTFLEMQSVNQFAGKNIGMYQLSASNQTRSLPPSDSAFMLSKIADAYPNIHWLALYDKFNLESYHTDLHCPKCKGSGKADSHPLASLVIPTSGSNTVLRSWSTGTMIGDTAVMTDAGTYTDSVPPAPASTPAQEVCPKCKGSGTIRPNIQAYCAPSLRELWALTTKAAIVISPDSMMIHVAGSMNVPCVGLWGLTKPVNRVKYYVNHVSVWKNEACPFAPCYSYGGNFPRYCPPRKERKVCECLGAISPQDVLTAMSQLVPPSSSNCKQ